MIPKVSSIVFWQKNPQRKAPTIVDDGFALSESRAIAKYLVAKYGNNKYYPQDIKARALIDQRLDFDIGTLYPKLFEVYVSFISQEALNNVILMLIAIGVCNMGSEMPVLGYHDESHSL